ncbi:holdfast anchor protein HfaD [Brevundimonas sp.]|jgi:hypothetical protein|uniref:holdfast anchor protein HfaD n=1 Tax=Brevundimonas sp. TaxID=1871086 RepID=UPI002E124DFB|nr:holdfast anchor protein HfaD [Brevundimonas sp.]
MIAATATCVAAGTEAQAQDPDAPIVLNRQFQGGAVAARQTVTANDADDQVTVSTSATGNTLSGAVETGHLTVDSEQELQGEVSAETTLVLNGDTDGYVTSVTQANGNYLAGGAYGGDLTLNATQTVGDVRIEAISDLSGGTARLIGGGRIETFAVANTVALAAQDGHVDGAIRQDTAATLFSSNYVAVQYAPGATEVSSQALGNVVAYTGIAPASQNLSLNQSNTGALVQAGTSANAGNAWDLAGRARAGGNQAVFANAGGSSVVEARQDNSARVWAESIVTSYDYGRVTSHAQASGNSLSVGNDDIYVRIDNAQFNSGGVQADASFSGAYGYDAYVGADAVGNSVTGYACAECGATLQADNVQTNEGDVSATARTTIGGDGRAVITGTNAVGNAANFYVTRPGQ